jgi:hypothetical protein
LDKWRWIILAKEAVMGEWTEVEKFSSPEDFHSFRRRLLAAVTEGSMASIPVGRRYPNVPFDEEWYRTPQGKIWRLVHPDFPFKGLFREVSLDEVE